MLVAKENINPHALDQLNSQVSDMVKRVFNSHYKMLVYFTNTFLHDRAEAEDVVVDCFSKVLILGKNMPTTNDMLAYLKVSCRNAAYDILKDRAHNKHAGDPDQYAHISSLDPDAERKAIFTEVLNELYQAIEQLPPQQKAVIRLILQGHSTAAIARILDLEVQNVRNHKTLAISKLKHEFKGLDLSLAYILFVLLLGENGLS